jgi:hypothetical protein
VNAYLDLRGFARGGSGGQGQRRRRAPQELTQEVQGRTPPPALEAVQNLPRAPDPLPKGIQRQPGCKPVRPQPLPQTCFRVPCQTDQARGRPVGPAAAGRRCDGPPALAAADGARHGRGARWELQPPPWDQLYAEGHGQCADRGPAGTWEQPPLGGRDYGERNAGAFGEGPLRQPRRQPRRPQPVWQRRVGPAGHTGAPRAARPPLRCGEKGWPGIGLRRPALAFTPPTRCA